MNPSESQVWHAVHKTLHHYMHSEKGNVSSYTDQDFCDAVVKEIFGEIPVTDESVTCNLGFKHTIEPYQWRKQYIPVLEILREAEKPLTTPQIKRKFSSKEQATVSKCPSELVHFGAVYVATNAGGRHYSITKAGDEFLDGNGKLPLYAYRKDLPLEFPEPPMVNINQICSL